MIKILINVTMILKQCDKREKLGREAAQFFSFMTLFETQIHSSKNLNFGIYIYIKIYFLNFNKIQFPKNLDLRSFQEIVHKFTLFEFSETRAKIDF